MISVCMIKSGEQIQYNLCILNTIMHKGNSHAKMKYDSQTVLAYMKCKIHSYIFVSQLFFTLIKMMIDWSCRVFLCLWVDNVWVNFENYVVLVIFVRFLTQEGRLQWCQERVWLVIWGKKERRYKWKQWCDVKWEALTRAFSLVWIHRNDECVTPVTGFSG